MEPINVAINKDGGKCSVIVTQGTQKAEIPCKDENEANMVKQALLAEIDKNAVQQGNLKPGEGEKLHVAKA